MFALNHRNSLQLQREIITSVIVIPALLPQMRVIPSLLLLLLRADFLFFGPVCTSALWSVRHSLGLL